MMIDILQELWNALRDGNESEIEISYTALECYGLDRSTARDILEAGKKFFGRNDPITENETSYELVLANGSTQTYEITYDEETEEKESG